MSDRRELILEINQKNLERRQLEEKLRESDRLASVRGELLDAAQEDKDRLREKISHLKRELHYKRGFKMSNCRELALRLNEKTLECSKLKEELREVHRITTRNLQHCIDTDWENIQLLMKIECLEFDKKRLQNEVGALRGQLSTVEKKMDISELEKKDLELVSALQELAAVVIDLRVRLSNCGHWAIYGVVPNIYDAMTLIRGEVKNVPTDPVTIKWS